MYAVFTEGHGNIASAPAMKSRSITRSRAGTAVEFPNVLLVSDGDDLKIGQPTVAGSRS